MSEYQTPGSHCTKPKKSIDLANTQFPQKSSQQCATGLSIDKTRGRDLWPHSHIVRRPPHNKKVTSVKKGKSNKQAAEHNNYDLVQPRLENIN